MRVHTHKRMDVQVALAVMEGLERLRLHPSTFEFLVHNLEVSLPAEHLQHLQHLQHLHPSA